MSKTIICITLSFFLVLFPVITAFSFPNTRTTLQQFNSSNQLAIPNDPPVWAKGNFTGVWGITLLGIPLNPSGWIMGYYENIGMGQLDSVYGTFNETNATSFLRGFMLWIFFVGFAGSLQTGNGTWVMGLGSANETQFYCRISAIIGPSFYILAEYTPFEKLSV